MKLVEHILSKPREEPTTYLPCVACFAMCSKMGTPGEHCWGRVLYEPDYEPERRHLCAGHAGPTYKFKPSKFHAEAVS
jgi:hypothetical protein